MEIEQKEFVKNLVITNLADWKDVDPESINVEACGKGANVSVFLVSSLNNTFNPIAVKLRGKQNVRVAGVPDIELAQEKCNTFQVFLAEAGLGPAIIAQSDEWQIEEYIGSTLDSKSLEDAKLAGFLLGKIHLLPTDWFEPFRQRILQYFSRFEELPLGSPIWTLVWNLGTSSSDGIPAQLVELDPELYQQFVDMLESMGPKTQTLSRVVNTHMDFTTANILKGSDRLYAIDFEQASVSSAGYDFHRYLSGQNSDIKRAFIEGYCESVQSLGFDETVDQILLDFECSFMNCRFASRQLAQMMIDDLLIHGTIQAGYRARDLVAEARSDPQAAANLLSSGIPKEVIFDGEAWPAARMARSGCWGFEICEIDDRRTSESDWAFQIDPESGKRFSFNFKTKEKVWEVQTSKFAQKSNIILKIKMQADQLLEIILYFICAWAGMIIGFLLVLYTVVVRKFRKPPGMLILWAIVSIMIFFSSIFVYAVYELWDWVMWHITWNFFGMLWTYAAILGSSYILASWIEVYTKVKEPLNMQYYKRSIYYHISWQSLAIVIALVGFLWDQYGAFHHGICFVKHDSLFQVVFFIPVICNIAAWTLLLMGLRIMDSQTQYLWRHMIFCFCFLALTIFAVILIWIILLAEDEDYKIVGRIFNYGVSVGYLWIMIYRFIDIIQYHKKWRVTQEQLRRNMWAPLRQISFFTDVFIEGVQDSMQALSFVFGRITPELISLEKRATYREKRNWNFDPRTSTFVSDGELSHASSSTWRTNARTLNVIEYAPALFAKIRATDQISAEYLSEILKPQDNISSVMENAINKGGRGGSFFYFTPDKRFIIKSLINTEKSVLCGKFLNDYSSTLDCWLLSRVYGIFKITVGGKKPICVMIMGSVIPPEAKIIAQFDIKGSRKDRYILSFHQENYSIGDLHESKIYKDQDFDEAIGEIKLPMANSIKEQLRKDSRLLASYNLMDYSVLIWVTEPIQNINSRFLFQSERYSYCIAIIDYLQEYTIAKRLERVGKAITSKAKHLSVMNPKDYVKRFNEKIENIIKDIN